MWDSTGENLMAQGLTRDEAIRYNRPRTAYMPAYPNVIFEQDDDEPVDIDLRQERIGELEDAKSEDFFTSEEKKGFDAELETLRGQQEIEKEDDEEVDKSEEYYPFFARKYEDAEEYAMEQEGLDWAKRKADQLIRYYDAREKELMIQKEDLERAMKKGKFEGPHMHTEKLEVEALVGVMDDELNQIRRNRVELKADPTVIVERDDWI